jgi:hypothetical protein
MYSTPLRIVLAAAFSSLCMGQTWELGAVGGYGWYQNPSITNPPDSVRAGFPPRAALGVVFGEDRFRYLGGEFRWLIRFGGPQLQSSGITVATPGHTNAITYDFLFHMTRRESRIRPFVAAGAGIKVYTGSFQDLTQPLSRLAVLRSVTQVEPAISAGAGLKFLLAEHIQLRLDFRTLMTPLPNDVIRPIGLSTRIHGWVYDFVPLAGISYVF